MLATETYEKEEPVNIGSGQEITIRDLVNRIVKLTGFEGEVQWDSDKPDGQTRRCLDVRRAEEELGIRAKTDFDTGLRNTIDWYIENKHRTGPV